MAEWDKGANGEIILHPLKSYEIATAFGASVVLRLCCLRQTEEGETAPVAFQLALSPQIANQLAEDLLKRVASLRHRPAGPPS